MTCNGFKDFKFEELKHFAELILSSGDRKEAIQKLNGLKRGYFNSKVLTPTTEKRLKIVEDLISSYK